MSRQCSSPSGFHSFLNFSDQLGRTYSRPQAPHCSSDYSFYLTDVSDKTTAYFSDVVLVPQAFHVSLAELDTIAVSPNVMLVFQQIQFLIVVFHTLVFLSNELLALLQFP